MYRINEKILDIQDNGTDVVITTETKTVRLYISDYQSCCENYGAYLYTPDDVKEYIGTTLKCLYPADSINENLQKSVDFPVDFNGGGAMFIDIITDNGVLQFACYNQHNGYYSHYAGIEIDGVSVYGDNL